MGCTGSRLYGTSQSQGPHGVGRRRAVSPAASSSQPTTPQDSSNLAMRGPSLVVLSYATHCQPAAHSSRPRSAESLKDWSPRPPSPRTRPIRGFSGAGTFATVAGAWTGAGGCSFWFLQASTSDTQKTNARLRGIASILSFYHSFPPSNILGRAWRLHHVARGQSSE